MRRSIRVSEVAKYVDAAPGYYAIRTRQGKLLKIGISVDLRQRLLRHRASCQRGLRTDARDILKVRDPRQVKSKSSILA